MFTTPYTMFRFLFPASFTILFFAGCGGGTPRPAGFPETVPCSVQVLDGTAPAGNCTVIFHPMQQAGVAVIARTGADGVAEMQTMQGNFTVTGVPAGEAVITLAENPEEPDNTGELPAVQISGGVKPLKKKETQSIIPAKLLKKETSPLKSGGRGGNIVINIADYR